MSTDEKISQLALIAGADIATDDEMELVDVSDLTMAASGTNKRTTIADLATAVGAGGGLPISFDDGTHVYSITGDPSSFEFNIALSASPDTPIATLFLQDVSGGRATLQTTDGTAFFQADGDTDLVQMQANDAVIVAVTGAVTIEAGTILDISTSHLRPFVAAATTLGTVIDKWAVYDASNVLVGYIPVYDAIT